jgi:hypothetical protein
MEPVSTTAIYALLSYFIGYYVGGDLYNYYKSQQNFRHIESELIDIKRKLNTIDNRLDTMNDK